MSALRIACRDPLAAAVCLRAWEREKAQLGRGAEPDESIDADVGCMLEAVSMGVAISWDE